MTVLFQFLVEKIALYQVIKALEYGLNPLCVTATTDLLSDIGRYNIENIKKFRSGLFRNISFESKG